MDYLKNPMGIEQRSMEIIEGELGDHKFSDEELSIVKRVIHTTADFEYKSLIHFSHDAIATAKTLLSSGITIYTDTQMIRSGINKSALKKLGIELKCYVHKQEIIKSAQANNITRSMAALDLAVEEGIEFYVFGNAPTALFRLIEHTRSAKAKPKFIVAAPVGFVGALESKEESMKLSTPQIAIRGRKGGSTVSASIINALLYMVVDRFDD